jgi:hypothetical protein
MPQAPLPILTFNYTNGQPLSFGSLEMYINTDGQASQLQICAGVKVTVPLDVNGVVVGSPVFWPNADISPPNSMYVINVYSQEGQLVSTIFQTIV